MIVGKKDLRRRPVNIITLKLAVCSGDSLPLLSKTCVGERQLEMKKMKIGKVEKKMRNGGVQKSRLKGARKMANSGKLKAKTKKKKTNDE